MTYIEEQQAVEAAGANGHNVEPDHPWGMTRVLRWTCKYDTCGMAVLLSPTGVIYGSASERKCLANKK